MTRVYSRNDFRQQSICVIRDFRQEIRRSFFFQQRGDS